MYRIATQPNTIRLSPGSSILSLKKSQVIVATIAIAKNSIALTALFLIILENIFSPLLFFKRKLFLLFSFFLHLFFQILQLLSQAVEPDGTEVEIPRLQNKQKDNAEPN